MTLDLLDQMIDRRAANSIKWTLYDEDVLPLWVADMDFPTPAPVIEAMRQKLDTGVLGYEMAPPALRETVCERMERLYGWHLTPDDVVVIPGVVPGFNLAAHALCQPGDGLLMQTPVYPPIYSAPQWQKLERVEAPLTLVTHGHTLHYEVDTDAFEAAITPRTRLFLLCQPHNPIGQDFTAEQLAPLAEACLRHDVVICSDEIHSELLMGQARHTPIAVLSPEVAQRTITLVAPSKTFNLAGLGCAFAIIQNPELRQTYEQAGMGLMPHVKGLSMAGALAAMSTATDEWLAHVRAYLTANRDAYVDYVVQHLPGIRTTVPEATYLAWLDCRDAGIQGSPYEFFLKEARVALNDGVPFGPGGEGFVRLNFACPRATLMEALERMRAALERNTGGDTD